MANEELDDLDAKQGSNKKMIIVIAVLGLILVGASVGLTIILLGGDKDEASADAAAEETVLAQPLYLPLEKMVINFTEKGPARYLQVEMQLMSRDQAVLDAVSAHMPVIRNDLLVLLGGLKYEQVHTLEGKEALRGQILEHIQSILAEHAEVKEGLEGVYFTSFVMQ